jgi:predicted transcriptional regulator YdeE
VLEDAEKRRKEIMKKITAQEFDKKFDNGEDIDEYLDFSAAIKLKDIKELKTQTKKVNVDFPEWVIESLDKEAKKIGVTRQSIIKVWIAERLKEEAEHLQVS